MDEEPRRGTRYADILGTEDSDHIVGTAKPEIICGLGGDDTIEGGGGGDIIYGGPGDDHLTFTDPGGDGRIGSDDVFQLFGGDGDDVLEIKRAAPDDIYPDLLVGGAGNDALIGPIVGPGVLFEGGAGHDAMIGTPLTTIGNNDMNGGDGHDVAMALNLSTGLRRPDQIDLDGKPELTLGTTCTVAVPMNPRSRERSQGKVTCGIPWPRELSGLKDIVSISTSIDETGKVSFDASMYEGLAGLSASGWRDVVDVQGSFSGDTCICDPLLAVGQAPKHAGQPLDWSK
jgi:hypothetical protein